MPTTVVGDLRLDADRAGCHGDAHFRAARSGCTAINNCEDWAVATRARRGKPGP
jgi:hypothetical protein